MQIQGVAALEISHHHYESQSDVPDKFSNDDDAGAVSSSF